MGPNKSKDQMAKESMKKENGQPENCSTKGGGEIASLSLARCIDHTLLRPNASDREFDQLCEEALRYRFHSVCVNSCRVSYVAGKLMHSDTIVCATIGFPLGQMEIRCKAYEARCCMAEGATELDMVLNVGLLKSGRLQEVEDDIQAVRKAAENGIVKVIIETGLLSNDDEKILACRLSQKAGADFVKTCTGFAGGAATPEDIALMRKTVGADMGVKASGGVRNEKSARLMLQSGADRIGTSSGVAIVTAGQGTGSY